ARDASRHDRVARRPCRAPGAARPQIATLSLHDALPILYLGQGTQRRLRRAVDEIFEKGWFPQPSIYRQVIICSHDRGEKLRAFSGPYAEHRRSGISEILS